MCALVAAQVDPRPATAIAATSPRPAVRIADHREHGAVVVGVGVDVEHARARPERRPPIASIAAASRPSEKFGTDSSGSTAVL